MQRTDGKIISNDEYNWALEVYEREKDAKMKTDDWEKAREILDELGIPDAEPEDVGEMAKPDKPNLY